MTTKEKIIHWAIKTLFEGELQLDDEDTVWDKKTKRMVQKKKSLAQVQRNYVLEKSVALRFPEGWGGDSTIDMNVSFQGKKIFVTGSLFSGGYYELDTKTLKLTVNN